jgi:transcriptional regulator with XRE-family HTH domain
MNKANELPDFPISQALTERRARLRGRLQGVRLAELAATSGISRQTLWRIREGRTTPDPVTLETVEAALNRAPSGTEAPP